MKVPFLQKIEKIEFFCSADFAFVSQFIAGSSVDC
jgi:hypothetical protein